MKIRAQNTFVIHAKQQPLTICGFEGYIMTTNEQNNNEQNNNEQNTTDDDRAVTSWPFAVILILSLVATWIGGLMTCFL